MVPCVDLSPTNPPDLFSFQPGHLSPNRKGMKMGALLPSTPATASEYRSYTSGVSSAAPVVERNQSTQLVALLTAAPARRLPCSR